MAWKSPEFSKQETLLKDTIQSKFASYDKEAEKLF